MMSFNPSLVRPSSLRMASGAKHAASASGSRAFSDDMNRSMGFGKCIDIANKDGHVLTEWQEYCCSVCRLWVTSDVETRRHHVCFTPESDICKKACLLYPRKRTLVGFARVRNLIKNSRLQSREALLKRKSPGPSHQVPGALVCETQNQKATQIERYDALSLQRLKTTSNHSTNVPQTRRALVGVLSLPRMRAAYSRPAVAGF
jgi:hypothetical protein